MPTELIADRRLWLTDEGKMVEDGDPKASRLLAGGEGQPVHPELAEQYGISSQGGKIIQAVKAKAAEPAPSPSPDKPKPDPPKPTQLPAEPPRKMGTLGGQKDRSR